MIRAPLILSFLLLAMFLEPLTASDDDRAENAKFETLRAKTLVVDTIKVRSIDVAEYIGVADDNNAVFLSPGGVRIGNRAGSQSTNLYPGLILVERGKVKAVRITTGDSGGDVSVFDADGNPRASVSMQGKKARVLILDTSGEIRAALGDLTGLNRIEHKDKAGRFGAWPVGERRSSSADPKRDGSESRR